MNTRNFKYYKKQRKKAIKETVLFYGKANSNNADLVAVYEKIKEKHPKLKVIWVNQGFVPYGEKAVEVTDRKFIRALARARYIIAMDHIERNYLKRKAQRYIQVCPLPINRLGLEMNFDSNITAKRDLITYQLQDARRWSYVNVGSKNTYLMIKEAFATKKKSIIKGRPAFDYIFNNEELKENLKLREDLAKVMLVDFKNENSQNFLNGIETDFTIINLADAGKFNLTKNEVKLVCDVYLTDHVANVEEMANFKRPMFLYNFQDESEVSMSVLNYFPGRVIHSQKELMANINHMEALNSFALLKCEHFNLEYNAFNDGNAADRLVKKVKFKKRKSKTKKYKKKANKWKKRFVWKILYPSLMLLPIDDKTIVFESFLGRNYSDNPKAIYEYMQTNNPEYNYVFFLNDPKDAKDEIPGNVKLVKKISFGYIYYLARAKFIIANSRMMMKYQKRDGQVYIQTWHGTPLKKLVMDMQNVNLPGTNKQNYLINFLNEAKRWDYLISANNHSTNVFNHAFLQENILEIGYPRNDILVNHTHADIQRVRNNLNLNIDDKVLLYAPTFRDDEYVSKGNYTQKVEIDLARLQEELPEWKILLRTHYLVTQNMDNDLENVINVSDYHDINHLYLAADVLMTDYSSVFFDYAILDRPMIFFAYDLEKYESNLRGFYFDYENTIPGKNISGTDELIEILADINHYEENFKLKRQMFRQEFTYLEEGTASKKVADLIESYKK